MKENDKLLIDKLIEKYDSPLYILFADSVRTNFRKFKNEFSRVYPKTKIAYAYKANSISGLLKIIHEEGALAEVASGFEYEMAKRLGVPGKSIVFNGPYKRKDELIKAIDDRALIIVDNKNELEVIEEIASSLGKSIEIGIRINTDVGIKQLPDRFGFNLESGDALEAITLCFENDLIRIVGLHIHLTSYIIEPTYIDNLTPARSIKLIWPKSFEMYRLASEKVLKFAKQIRDKFGITLKYLDMGGGYPEVKFLKPYAKAIIEPIIDAYKDDEPMLILEPGRAIVKNAMHLITTVVDVKEMTDEKRRITLDAGINLLPTSLWSLQEFEVVKKSDEKLKETIVYGPLCLQTDILGITKLPHLNVGDRLIIKNVGAYNISQSSSFIFPRPYIILIDKNKITVLRRSETIKEILSPEGHMS